MSATVPLRVIDAAVVAVAEALPKRLRTRACWRLASEDYLWRELVSAILGSAVTFEAALRAVNCLQAHGLLAPRPAGRDTESDIESCLRKNAGYRFPRSRARQISTTSHAIYCSGGTLGDLLRESADGAVGARRNLVGLCDGIGPKQASLFLRNIGFGEPAILDRHVLEYLRQRNLYKSAATSIGSITQYEEIEKALLEIAEFLQLSMTETDLSIWVAMRTLAQSRMS